MGYDFERGKEITGKAYVFKEPGQSVIGKYLGPETVIFKIKDEKNPGKYVDKPQVEYVFDTGEELVRIGETVRLARAMKSVRVNDVVEVCYIGEAKNEETNRTMKEFKIYGDARGPAEPF